MIVDNVIVTRITLPASTVNGSALFDYSHVVVLGKASANDLLFSSSSLADHDETWLL
jgi:hypothetical protein